MPVRAPAGNDDCRRSSGMSECAEVWPQNWSVTDALTSVEEQSRTLALALSRGDAEAYEEAERAAATLALLRTPIRLSFRKPEDSDDAALSEKCGAASNASSVEKAESAEIAFGPTVTSKKGESEETESGATEILKVARGTASQAEAGNTTPSAVHDADAASSDGKDASDRDQKVAAKPERLLVSRHVSIDSSTTDKDASVCEKFQARSETAAQRHAVGSRVEYYSQTVSQWIPAVVQGFDEASGSYDLDVHPVAPPQKVRAPARSLSKGDPVVDIKDQAKSSHLFGGSLQHQLATSSSSGARERLPEGSAAEYWSTTFGGWIPAVIQGFSEETGTYVLDIQPVAVPSKVRAAVGTPSLHASTSAISLNSISDQAARVSRTSSLQGQSPSAHARAGENGNGPMSPLSLRHDRASCSDGGRPEWADGCRCGICQATCDVGKLVLLQCEHLFCLPCLQNHVLSLDFVRQRVACPSGHCSENLTIPEIKQVVGDKAFSERHEKMLQEDEELARQLAVEDTPTCKRPPMTERSPAGEFGVAWLPSTQTTPEVAVTQLPQVTPAPRPKAKAAEHAQRMANMDEEAARALQEEFAKEDAGGPTESQFDCPLCLLSHDREEGIELDCQHRLCVTCFHAYLQSKITDAQVAEDELVCPIPDCKTEITTAQVEGGTHGTDLWDKFLSFRFKAWTPSAEDGVIVQCPKPECGFSFMVPDGLNKVRCPICAKDFCPKCMEDHSGSTCQAFQAWKAENSKADQNFEELMAHERWRRCPKCGAPSERESGCNFMQCRSAICRKHTYWCYVCGKELPKSDHYSHYPKGPYEDICNTPEAERLVPALAQPWEGGTLGAAVEAVAAVGDAFRGWFRTPVGAT